MMCLAGCETFGVGRQSRDYRTVVSPPVRDEETARRRNVEAIDRLERGKLEKAEKLVQEALIADVTFGPAHNTLGRIYYEQGKLYLAAWEFEYARRMMPDQPEPLNNLGLVFEAAEKLDMAVAQFEEAHSLAPNVPDYLGNLIRARLKRGDSKAEIKPLLHQLLFVETRPQWKEWARETLARWSTLPSNSASSNASPVAPENAGPLFETIPPPGPETLRPTEEYRGSLPAGQPPVVAPATK